MPQIISRRTLIKSLALGAPALALSNLPAMAGEDIMVDSSSIGINPVKHASLWLDWGNKTIIIDPVGSEAGYSEAGTPDLILVTHIHQDHFAPDTLAALAGPNTKLIAPPTVAEQLSGELASRTTVIGNGEATNFKGLGINAVPAYNITAERLQFHPEGRDNGYVLSDGEARIYIAGDTEATPEFRAMTDIDIAFVPMNLPYTMGIEQAADGVAEFGPKVVYPYHYRGSDTDAFAALVANANPEVEVRLYDWYA